MGKGNAQLSELDAASNACLKLCSRHGFATGHGDTVADMICEIDAQIGERLAATPADPDAMNEKRAAEDAKLASNVREATIEECAKAVEVRIKGTDGLPGGNDWGHYAPYNCEVLACAAAIRALSTPGAPKP